MELGDYAYLVFIAIGIIASLFGNKKKGKAGEPNDPFIETEEETQQRTQQQERTAQDIIDEILGTEKEEPRPEPSRPQRQSRPAPTPEPEKPSRFSDYESAIRRVEERKQRAKKEAPAPSPMPVSEEEQHQIDLRQAVIHSIILERPDF